MTAVTVTREIALSASRRGHCRHLVLWLTWSTTDPLAVTLVVGAQPAHPSLLRGSWVLLRDTLRAVLGSDDGRVAGPPHPGGSRPAATGGEITADVPLTDVTASVEQAGYVQLIRHHGHVTLILQTAPLPCVVTAPIEPLRAFLDETDRMVPPGAEDCPAALEAEIARMLAGN